jgi:hypothetical protein
MIERRSARFEQTYRGIYRDLLRLGEAAPPCFEFLGELNLPMNGSMTHEVYMLSSDYP